MKDIIGEILQDGSIKRGYTGNGFVYKNSIVYDRKMNMPCYVAELTDQKYYPKDFLDIAENYVENTTELQEHISDPINKATIQTIADLLFENCTWQHPETLIVEWIDNGVFEK